MDNLKEVDIKKGHPEPFFAAPGNPAIGFPTKRGRSEPL